MRGIIDRFEGDWVVVEIDGDTVDFEKSLFPKEALAGDVVEINGDKVKILKAETDKLRKEIEELMDDVWED
ncbi:DUF3006 domain-containing protein [Lederbergia panacisoli]|uniref:DUF3006 domain-containing protein n=1 Tax=Lederbergia panacisoli TaxID=1255251 RepID=UPI00214A97D0|nr:DUF3006 domain-containing protein [Lederbergia panacisoli]MCR2822102.1 DUF3006 domain-containing protein [Lederbergia panacisoli]